MSKAGQNNRDVRILFQAYKTAKESGKESEEDIFGIAVNAASKILELELSLSTTEAKLAAGHYAKLYRQGKDISEIISKLIKESEQQPVDGKRNYPLLAYDTLASLNAILSVGTGPIPDALINFAFDVQMDIGKDETKKKRPRPTRRGRRRDTNLARDIALYYTHFRMVPWGYPKFRSEKKDKKYDKGEDQDQDICSYKGETTVDILGCAYEKLIDNNDDRLGYSRLEQIILSDDWDNNLVLKVYILQKLADDLKFNYVSWV